MKVNPKKIMRQTKGFTLIELLIVIAVLGILIVAILSAVDPLEQIRKARDAGRKSDSAELLSAYERYYSTFQCFPWDANSPDCDDVTTASRTSVTTPIWTTGGQTDFELIERGELKGTFPNRNSLQNDNIWMVELSTRELHVCFEPESRSGRIGGYGNLSGSVTDLTTSGLDCTGDYVGTTDTATCWVCLPQ